MKICAISDIHGNLIKIPECDILIIAGDICPADNHSIYRQESWLKTEFYSWSKEIPAKNVCFIAGNHDFFFENKLLVKDFVNILPNNIHYLFDSEITINKLKIYGTPWQPIFRNWAFNLSDTFQKEAFSFIPYNIDILISHSPPFGFGDKLLKKYAKKYSPKHHLGSKELLYAISQKKCKYVFCGHIHSASHKLKILNNECNIINVSILDEDYNIKFDPFIINI